MNKWKDILTLGTKGRVRWSDGLEEDFEIKRVEFINNQYVYFYNVIFEGRKAGTSICDDYLNNGSVIIL